MEFYSRLNYFNHISARAGCPRIEKALSLSLEINLAPHGTCNFFYFSLPQSLSIPFVSPPRLNLLRPRISQLRNETEKR